MKRHEIPTYAMLFALAVLTGCAASGPPRATLKLVVSSTPPGAAVYTYDEIRGEKTLEGRTPLSKAVENGNSRLWLVVEMPEYETEVYRLPPAGLARHSLKLETDFSIQVKGESSRYTKAYVKQVVALLKQCEEILNKPGLLASPSIARARQDFEALRAANPKYRGAALDRAVQRLFRHIDYLPTVRQFPNPGHNQDHVIYKEIRALLLKIYFGVREY